MLLVTEPSLCEVLHEQQFDLLADYMYVCVHRSSTTILFRFVID
jgi:hypothetical protein